VPSGYSVTYGITVAVAVSVVSFTGTGKERRVSVTATEHGAHVENAVIAPTGAEKREEFGEKVEFWLEEIGVVDSLTCERMVRACWSNVASRKRRIRHDGRNRTSVFMV